VGTAGHSVCIYFHSFSLNPTTLELRKADALVKLAHQPARILSILAARPGEIVSREELAEEIWGRDTFVDYGQSLNAAMRQIRLALGDNAEHPNFIETIPKRGYRFVAQVVPVETPANPPSVAGGISAGDSERIMTGVAPAAPLSGGVTRRSGRWNPARATAAIAFVLVLSAALWISLRSFAPVKASSGRVTLVVLPVENLSGDSSRDYISDGLTEEMISQLGRLDPRKLGVIARTSSMAYKNSSKRVDQIARELKADYVLESSIRWRNDNRLRLTSQLIRASDQTHVWAQDFDRPESGLVVMEDELSRAVASQIQRRLDSNAPVVASNRFLNSQAYEDYLKGRFSWNLRTRAGLMDGLQQFQKVLANDPSNARAYAGIADSYNELAFYDFVPSAQGIPQARQAALKAVQLGPDLAEAHAALGYVYFMWDWRWKDAESEFQRAIALDSNYVSAHHWYAMYLTARGRHAESAEQMRIARELDPRSPIILTASGFLSYFARDYKQGVEFCNAALDLDPNFAIAHAVMGRAYEGEKRYDKAIAELHRAIDLSGGSNPVYQAWLAYAYALSGDTTEARKFIADSKHDRDSFSDVGAAYAALNDTTDAISWLQRADDASLTWMDVDPHFDPLRSDPRFQIMIQKSGLPPALPESGAPVEPMVAASKQTS